MDTAVEARPPQLLLWILLPAAIGFGVGLVGPVICDPEANLGPLLGIFVTGPVGAILGLVLGVAARVLRLGAARQWHLLWGGCAALTVGTLYLSLPGPKWRGAVIDAEIRECKPPAQALDRAMSFWEKSPAGTAARPGWQADLRRTAQADPGVVLELNVARELRIFEHRKPWNKGRITSTGWQGVNRVRRYYTRYSGGSCPDYPVGTRSVHYAYYPPSPPAKGPREWPPTSNLPLFLDLHILVPVPDEYQRLIGDVAAGRVGSISGEH